jgi:hypothetical protein
MGQTPMFNVLEYNLLMGSIFDFPGTDDLKTQAKTIDFLFSELSEDFKKLQIIIYWTDLENVTHEKHLSIIVVGYQVPEDLYKELELKG